MAKNLSTDEVREMALNLGRNKHYITRLDDYEKQEIKSQIEFDIMIYDEEIRIGIKNIPQERVDKIEVYRAARRFLKVDEIEKQRVKDKISDDDEGKFTAKALRPEDEIECPGFAIYLHFKTDFEKPTKRNTAEWKRVAENHNLNFSGNTVRVNYEKFKTFTDRKHKPGDKHYNDALALFKRFPDPAGLKKLRAEIKK